MKILPLQNYSNISLIDKNQQHIKSQQQSVSSPDFKPVFCGNLPINIPSNKFLSAKAYLNQAMQNFQKVKKPNLYMFDLNKLDGIQD